MRLIDVNRDINYKIINIYVENDFLRSYLFGLGFVKDTIIKIVRKSFFKGAIIVYLRNYYLAISKDIAYNIEVDFV